MSEPAADAAVNMASDIGHTAEAAPGPKPDRVAADVLREPIDEKGTQKIGNELKKCVGSEHGGMMALAGPNVKAGKPG